MKQVKRLGRIIAGFALLIAGIAMLALPGPGWVTIAVGLALLARDFPWAEKTLQRLKAIANRLLSTARTWLHRVRERLSSTS